MAKILLINPPYYANIYSDSIVKITITPGVISLGLAAIAAPLIQQNHLVEILDLNIFEGEVFSLLKEKLNGFSPDFVGITFTTPLVKIARDIGNYVKAYNQKIKVIGGGPHCSSLPEETITDSSFDAIVVGEGDFTLRDLVDSSDWSNVTGLIFRADDKIIVTAKREVCVNLDSLPYPALNLFQIDKYRYPRITSKRNPVASMETSRGCFAQCIYCNKSVFGYKFRVKSPNRVVDEMEYIMGLGFKEIHIVDDGFTTDLARATQICQEIQKRNLKFPWYVRGGIRVDRISYELLSEMKKAGCYHIPFGIESGSQKIVNRIKKGITLAQVETAVNWAKKLGYIVDGYFMIGLPGETEDDLKETISFACKLNFDFVKFAITLPLPATALFKEIEATGRTKTKDWSKYTFSTSPKYIYDHDTLTWNTLDKYYYLAYKSFYFRPIFIWKSLFAGIRHGTIFDYIKAFFRFLIDLFPRQEK